MSGIYYIAHKTFLKANTDNPRPGPFLIQA